MPRFSKLSCNVVFEKLMGKGMFRIFVLQLNCTFWIFRYISWMSIFTPPLWCFLPESEVSGFEYPCASEFFFQIIVTWRRTTSNSDDVFAILSCGSLPYFEISRTFSRNALSSVDVKILAPLIFYLHCLFSCCKPSVSLCPHRIPEHSHFFTSQPCLCGFFLGHSLIVEEKSDVFVISKFSSLSERQNCFFHVKIIVRKLKSVQMCTIQYFRIEVVWHWWSEIAGCFLWVDV